MLNLTQNSPLPIPAIIKQNTYFWNSNNAAASRRANEKRRMNEVDNFMLALGFTGGNGNYVHSELPIRAEFSYSESACNVYKRFSVYLNDQKKDIRLLKKYFNVA